MALAAAWPARAAAQAQSQPYVVLVGISDYADKQIKPRPHAEADAKALYDLFTDKGHLGADGDHVRLLLGSADAKRHSEPATHENITKALRWAASNARRGDLVIFAFIGQGAPLGERTCYLASDSTFKDRAKNAVGATDIEAALEKLKSHHFCVFLDANFKGFDPGKEPSPELNVANFYKFAEYLGSGEQLPMGRAVFMATQKAVTTSLDLDKHGAFTQAVVDGLKGAADKEGYEPDGVVTVDELIEYLDKQIPKLVRQHGKTKAEKEQLPLVLTGESSHFVITHNPAVTARVHERVEKFNKIARQDNLDREVVEEGRRLLSQMPKLEAYRALRKDYQQLADGTMSAEKFEKARADVLDRLKYKRTAALEWAAKVVQATQILETEYVKNINQGELVAWAVRGLYNSIEEKIPQDIKDRLEKAKELREGELTILLADVRQRLGTREDLDNHHDLDYALQRMLRHLDPYTTYIDPETLARFRTETQGQFTGIGIQIRKDTARDMLMVVSPIKDSPAYKAGILAGDVITTIVREVDNKGNPLDKPEVTSTKGLALSDAVKMILGQPRTKVKLVIEREGSPSPLEFEITRGRVEVETVIGAKRKKDDSWDYVIDPDNRICYVRLTSFAKKTSVDLARALVQLRKQGIKGFVLDLRFNPGGLLQSAVEISDMFIDDGLIVTIKPRVGKPNVFMGESEGSLLDFPMVCLVNGGSASGSEIVSACLQDHNRALIMGERSYGKGSVQNIQSFEEGELKFTTASFWRPSGKNLNKSSTSGKEEDEWGVTPDKGYVLKLSRKEQVELDEHLRNQEVIPRRDLAAKEKKSTFKDRQLELALDYLRGQIKTASRAATRKAG
jgi:C-terminal peptidase prc